MSFKTYQAIINRLSAKDGKAVRELVAINDLLFTQAIDLNSSEIIDGKQMLNIEKHIKYNPTDHNYYVANFDEFFNQYEEVELIINDFVSITEDENGNLKFIVASFSKERGEENFKTLYQYEKNNINAPISNKQLDIIKPILSILKDLEPESTELAEKLQNNDVIDSENFNQFNILVNNLSRDLFSLLEQSIDEKLQVESLEKSLDLVIPPAPVNQIDFLNKGNLTILTDKVTRTLVTTKFPENTLRAGKFKINVTVDHDQDGNPIKVPVTLELKEDLSYYQLLVISANFTLQQLNPDAKGIPILDIINLIHKRPSGIRIDTSDPFYNVAYEEIKKLIGITFTLDTSNIIEYRAKNGNKRAINYKNSGGKSEITDTFLSAYIAPLPYKNGKDVDCLIPKTGFFDNDFYKYVLAINQIKTIPEEISKTPLRLGLQNDSIFNYIALKVANLPYHNNINFLDKKLEILKAVEQAKHDLEEDLKKQIKELQSDIKTHQRQLNSKTDIFKTTQTNALRSELKRLEKNLDIAKKQLAQLKKSYKDPRYNPKEIKELEKELTAPYKKMQQEIIRNPKLRSNIRINLDTLIKELKIESTPKARIAGYVKKILDSWISDGILIKYKENKKRVKGEETTVSFEVYFF